MVTFEVNDMTCGHCVSTITKAVKALDPQAQVEVNLAAHRVTVDSASADQHSLQEAIAEAGFTPVDAAPAPQAKTAPAARTSGCCCESGAASRCG